jgi:hypothetical protein
MSRQPFDPSELDDRVTRPGDPIDPAVEELERYASLTADRPSHDLADRVMSAVERAPAPRRGILSWLALPSGGAPLRRLARVSVLAATLVLAVAGALFAGELAQLFRDGVGSSPSPSVIESVEPSPSESAAPSLSGTPEESEDASGSPEASEEPGSAQPSATPRPTSTAGQPSPTGSEEESTTPRPSATPEQTGSPTPTQTPD